jgi:hypothetical protein
VAVFASQTRRLLVGCCRWRSLLGNGGIVRFLRTRSCRVFERRIEMAHLWLREDSSGQDGGDWSPVPLAGDSFAPAPACAGVVLRRAVTSDGEHWLLLGASTARVNGRPLDTGIAVLHDRDELLVDGRRVYFSTQVLAMMEPAPPSDRPLVCPRCKQAIAPGTPSVVCPGCKVRHHQDAGHELPCWTYAPTCALCDHPTALDRGYRWAPEP